MDFIELNLCDKVGKILIEAKIKYVKLKKRHIII